METGNFSRVRRRKGGWLGLEYRRHVRVWLSEWCPEAIAKSAVQRGRPDLREHVSAVERPSHLLLLDHPLSNKRITADMESPKQRNKLLRLPIKLHDCSTATANAS